jgi:hypothetical protein
MSEQQTTIPASDYTPIDQRPADYGDNIREDRRREQIQADNRWQPIAPPPTDEHQHDSKIEELEEQVKQSKRDAEFGALKTVEERALYTLREQREKDFAREDAAKELARHIESVAPQLARLAEIRSAMIDGEGFTASQVVAIEKTAKQWSNPTACKKTAAQMLRAVEENYNATIEAENDRVLAQIAGLQNKASRLQEKLKPVEPEPTGLTDEDKLYVKARAEWEAAREAGNDAEATRLRSVYFAERMKRERA